MRFERIALAALALIATAGLMTLQGHDAWAQTAKDLKCKGCVNKKDMANNAVTTGKLKNNAVSAAKLRNGAATESKLATGAVTESKLATGAVGTAKLQDGAVTDAKLSDALSSAISSASALNVFDDNGTLIGEFAYSSDVLIESGGFLFSLGIDRNRFFGRVMVRFTDGACMTNPYIFAPAAFNNIVPLAAIGDGDVYIADTSAAVQSFSIGSQLSADGTCTPQGGGNQDGKPAFIVTTFVSASFTTPFFASR